MFTGIKDENELPEFIVSKGVVEKTIRACTRKNARCNGELKGKFLYEDGTEDDGIFLKIMRAEIGGHVYKWSVANND
jgi:hypothetical protein